MKRLRRFLALPSRDRCLLVRAAFLVGSIRIGLCVIPFQGMRRILAWRMYSHVGQRTTAHSSLDRVAWAVRVASRYVPRATCLAQALAAHRLLEREGHPACLRIGVARNAEGLFQAHAWVESRGEVVLGGLATGRYTPLLALEREES